MAAAFYTEAVTDNKMNVILSLVSGCKSYVRERETDR
jgi:hypothetical protein